VGTLAAVAPLAARTTTATTHRVAVLVALHAVAMAAAVSVVALAAALPAGTTVAPRPVVKVAATLAAMTAVAIVVLLPVVTAKVMAASLVLVMRAVAGLLPVAMRAHRAVISLPASRRLPSLLVVVASLLWPTTLASVLLAQPGDR